MNQAAGRQFVQQGKGGRIVNVGSIDSIHPSSVGLAAYDASKGGVLMLSKNFALEMAPHGVWASRVNELTAAGRITSLLRRGEGAGLTRAGLLRGGRLLAAAR